MSATIVVYSDVLCPWAHLALFRVRRAIDELDVTDRVEIDHRSFPLELFNERPMSRRVLDQEIAALAAIEPDAGWSPWARPDWEHPVTSLPALEAVQNAKRWGLPASDRMDAALRAAYFVHSRCVSLHSELLTAADTAGLDHEAVREMLETGRGRAQVFAGYHEAKATDIEASPTLVWGDGEPLTNPGLAMHWSGKPGTEGAEVVIEQDDPTVVVDLVARVAESG